LSTASTPQTERIRQALADRRVALVCMVLGVLLASPALGSGLLADDVGQRAFILEQLAGRGERPWWDMFVLIGATPEELERLRFLGHVPWWTSSNVHVAFWRPLTAATHYLDYALWPGSPWLMHLHQLLWRAGACGLAWALFRRVASSPAAGGAAALGFALTHLHLTAAAWLAHRNAALVVVFGLACLLAHDRWRRDAWRAGAVLGPIAFAAALLSGEMGVAVLGFVLAHALALDPAKPQRKLVALAPYLLVLVAWRTAYDALGYGVVGSGVYLDPLSDPVAWLSATPRRFAELLVYLLGPPGPIGALLSGRTLGAVVIALAVVVAARMSEASRRRAIRFAGLGVILSLIPLTTTAPHDRVLVVATIGSTLAFGEVLDLALLRGAVALRIGAGLITIVHYLVSPAGAVGLASNIERIKVAGANYPIAAGLDDAQLRRQSLVVVHTPELLWATLLPVAREAQGLNRPNFVWVLHAEPTAESLSVRRVDAHTVELHDPRGWLRGPDSTLLRGPSEPFAVGDELATLDFVLTVLEVDGVRPVHVAVRMRAPLDSAGLVIVTWADGDFDEWGSTP
jgi:hypothetical protein